MPIHFSSNPSMVNQVMAAWQPPVQLDAEHVEGLWADWGWWEVVMWVFLVFGGCVLLFCNAVWLGALAYEWAQIIWTWQKTGQVAVYSLILAAASGAVIGFVSCWHLPTVVASTTSAIHTMEVCSQY